MKTNETRGGRHSEKSEQFYFLRHKKMTTKDIYTELSETYPLAPLPVIRKMTGAQWDKAILQIPQLFALRLSIENDKKEAKVRAKQFISKR